MNRLPDAYGRCAPWDFAPAQITAADLDELGSDRLRTRPAPSYNRLSVGWTPYRCTRCGWSHATGIAFKPYCAPCYFLIGSGEREAVLALRQERGDCEMCGRAPAAFIYRWGGSIPQERVLCQPCLPSEAMELALVHREKEQE